MPSNVSKVSLNAAQNMFCSTTATPVEEEEEPVPVSCHDFFNQ